MTQHRPRPSKTPSTASQRIMASPWFYVGLGSLVGFALVACVALVAGLTLFRPQLAALLETPTPAPTPACGLPTLSIGGTTFFILPVRPGADGSVEVPADSLAVAYWIEGARIYNAFALSPTPENLALKKMFKEGDPVKVSWEDCNSTLYGIESIESGSPDHAELQEGSTPGLTVFMPAGPVGEGFVIRGGIQEGTQETVLTTEPGAEIVVPGGSLEETQEIIPTAAPDAGGRLAEISLLETTTSADGSQLLLGVSFLNYGENDLTLSPQDILIIPEDAPAGTAPLALTHADPALPARISPGEARTFNLTFPRPPTPAATLKIFDVQLYFDGY